MPQLPGSSRDTPQLPWSSDDMPDVPDSSMGSSPCSRLEPEQEVVPPSLNASGPPEPLPPLQQALRRSPAALDGIPSRTRSRSPHRAHLAFRENAKAGNCFHGFLARRVNKKSAAVLLLRPPPGGLPNVPEGSLLRARLRNERRPSWLLQALEQRLDQPRTSTRTARACCLRVEG